MITGWFFFQRWYDSLTSKIRWNGSISEPIQELQGVRQAGIWSPTAYTICINSLLNYIQHKQLGVYIGTNYCGIPTVADDVTLISHDPMELQIMLNVQSEHANSNLYLVSQRKSSIVVMNGSQNYEWTFNNENLFVSESATHLGIQRCSNITATLTETVENRIITASKTVFALMAAGLYGLNGVNPKVSIHLVQTYVTPRLLYGLGIV